MSETKFTTGPWEWLKADGEHRTLVNVELDKIINSAGSEDMWLCPENIDANAALIAAAPELYEALVDCAIDLENEIRNRESYAVPRHFERDLMVVERAVAVLKKAKGE